jgi:hypothetical protein
MRRFLTVLTLGATLPLMAAVPASRVREPNAVFVYGMPESGRLQATLFDRAKQKAIDHIDAYVELPIVAGVSMGANDAVQFSPATSKVYALVNNVSGYDGSTVDERLGYDLAIVEASFDFKKPATVFSCDGCFTEQWLVHPTKPVLYVSVPDQFGDGGDQFKNAKLVEVTLSPRLRTRVLGRIPPHAALRVTPDGKKVFAFAQATGSREPYGALVTIDPSTRRRTQTTVNFPTYNVFGLQTAPASADASPDALEMAYHMGTIDLLSKKTTAIAETSPYALDNWFIGWSRNADRLLFQLMQKSDDPNERLEVPLLYDRKKKEEWILPLQDANFLDWAPAQTAILFKKRGDIGYFDLEKKAWVFVDEGMDGAWVTMPTKRVPKR